MANKTDDDLKAAELPTKNDSRLKVQALVALKKIISFYGRNFLTLVCGKLIAIGLVLRFWIVNSPLGNIDEKQALTLLQAKDFSRGHISLMREGRFTSGSLEILLNVPVVAIFGTTKTATWIVPLLLLVATSFVLWRSFVNTPHKETMRLVMASLWISPAYFVISTSRATGHVSLEIFLYTCLFASAYYAAHSLRNLRYFYIWAFLAGVAAWINPVSILFSILSLIWIFLCAPAMKGHKTRALAYFVLGSGLLWIHLIGVVLSNEKIAYVSEGIDVNSEFPKSALATLGQLVWGSTYLANGDSDSKIGILFYCLNISFIGMIIYSIYKLSSAKRTDFKKLQSYTFALFLAIPIIFFVSDKKLLPEAMIPIIIPTLFLVICANKSRKYTSIALVLLLAISVISINLSLDETSATSNTAVSRLTNELKTQQIKRALTSHALGYPITAKSKDKILVTPFDGNDFNKRRSEKVHKNVEAILIDTNNKKQIDLAFCVQGTFGTTFEVVRSKSFDILIVNKDLRNKIWDVVKRCNARAS